MRLSHLLDPDSRLWSVDKLQHFAKGYLTCLLLTLKLGLPESLALTAILAGVYEAGQTDTALALGQLGKPGFGFGILDIFVEVLGGLAWVATLAILKLAL